MHSWQCERVRRTLGLYCALVLASTFCSSLGLCQSDSQVPGKPEPESLRDLRRGDAQLSLRVDGSDLTVTTSQRLSGGVDSIRWNGMEFIDSYDHGRQMQTAVSYDAGAIGEYWAERFNPTECGSRRDGLGPSSSSRLLAIAGTERELRTSTQMAFWLAPDEFSFGRSALNTKVLSDQILHKRIRLGVYTDSRVIEVAMTLQTPATQLHRFVQYEVLTGYMPECFSKFYGLDSKSGELVELSDGPGEQAMPIVFSTEDNRFAMGAIAMGRPDWITEPTGYGRFRFEQERVVKWNVVMRYRKAPELDRFQASFRVCVVVGGLQEVRSAMKSLQDGTLAEVAEPVDSKPK